MIPRDSSVSLCLTKSDDEPKDFTAGDGVPTQKGGPAAHQVKGKW
jgi:hypothetical protein